MVITNLAVYNPRGKKIYLFFENLGKKTYLFFENLPFFWYPMHLQNDEGNKVWWQDLRQLLVSKDVDHTKGVSAHNDGPMVPTVDSYKGWGTLIDDREYIISTWTLALSNKLSYPPYTQHFTMEKCGLDQHLSLHDTIRCFNDVANLI